MTQLGRLVPPYPRDTCTDADCGHPFTDDNGAFMYRDLETGKLVIFCEATAADIELNYRDRFMLVPL